MDDAANKQRLLLYPAITIRMKTSHFLGEHQYWTHCEEKQFMLNFSLRYGKSENTNNKNINDNNYKNNNNTRKANSDMQ